MLRKLRPSAALPPGGPSPPQSALQASHPGMARSREFGAFGAQGCCLGFAGLLRTTSCAVRHLPCIRLAEAPTLYNFCHGVLLKFFASESPSQTAILNFKPVPKGSRLCVSPLSPPLWLLAATEILGPHFCRTSQGASMAPAHWPAKKTPRSRICLRLSLGNCGFRIRGGAYLKLVYPPALVSAAHL